MDAKKGTINANFVRPGTLGSIVTTILDLALSRGIAIEEVAQVMDLSAVDYARLDTRISNDEVGRLMSLMINRWPNTAISMEIARSAPFTMLGGLVKGAQFANDIEAMLEWFVSNQKIISDQSVVHLEKTDSEVAMVVAHPREHQDQGILLEAAKSVIW